MQDCTSLQTDNHASTQPLSFYRPDALPAAQPTVSKHWRHIDCIRITRIYQQISLSEIRLSSWLYACYKWFYCIVLVFVIFALRWLYDVHAMWPNNVECFCWGSVLCRLCVALGRWEFCISIKPGSSAQCSPGGKQRCVGLRQQVWWADHCGICEVVWHGRMWRGTSRVDQTDHVHRRNWSDQWRTRD